MGERARTLNRSLEIIISRTEKEECSISAWWGHELASQSLDDLQCVRNGAEIPILTTYINCAVPLFRGSEESPLFCGLLFLRHGAAPSGYTFTIY